MDKIIEKYTDIKQPGSFSGLSGFLKNNKKLKLKNEKKTLLTQPTYTLHTPARHSFPRTKWISGGIDQIWQVDLIDMRKFKFQNSHFEYVLTCIDVFSKKAWAVPIKKKTSNDTMQAFKLIFESKRIPKTIFLDKGNEFKGECEKLFQKHQIKIVTSTTKLKASVVERFNRTLKEKIFRIFTFNKNTKYSKILPEILDSYNNSYHRSIKTTPNSVNEKNKDKIFQTLYGDLNTFSFDNYIRFKFKRGDYVRIATEKNIFDKGYTPNYSKEIYVVWKLIASNPPRYNIRSLDNEEYTYNFYTEELQRVSQSEFPYDSFKVIEENKEEILVEKLNSSKRKLLILKKSDIE